MPLAIDISFSPSHQTRRFDALPLRHGWLPAVIAISPVTLLMISITLIRWADCRHMATPAAFAAIDIAIDFDAAGHW